jgi:hypothetical protein
MARERSIAELKPKPRNDAYTVLLTISLVAMIMACLLLWYDLKSYPTPQPPKGYGDVARPAEAPPAGDFIPPPPPQPTGGTDTEKKEPEKAPEKNP